VGRTLADDIVDDLDRVILNTQEFAEPLLVRKNGGAWRSINAIVSEHPGAVQDQQYHLVQQRVIEVFAKKDVLEGIDNPRLKFEVKWDGLEWDFSGIAGSHGSSMYVQFTSKQLEASGQRGTGRL